MYDFQQKVNAPEKLLDGSVIYTDWTQPIEAFQKNIIEIAYILSVKNIIQPVLPLKIIIQVIFMRIISPTSL